MLTSQNNKRTATGMFIATLLALATASMPVLAADVAAGAAKFKTFCAMCHGDRGAGDGPAAAGLNPAPRNFSDADWQASVDDEHIRTVTRDGGAAVGLSPLMTPWGHSLSQDDLDNLVAFIRTLDD